MFLGLDSSTQSLTAVLIDPAAGGITCQISVNFSGDLPQYDAPSGFIPDGANGEVHSNPLMWLDALDLLFSRLATTTDLSKVAMIAGSGQQHGSVYLDSSFVSRLAALGVSALVVGCIGEGAIRVCGANGIAVARGASGSARAAALAFARGELEDSGIVCGGACKTQARGCN